LRNQQQKVKKVDRSNQLKKRKSIRNRNRNRNRKEINKQGNKNIEMSEEQKRIQRSRQLINNVIKNKKRENIEEKQTILQIKREPQPNRQQYIKYPKVEFKRPPRNKQIEERFEREKKMWKWDNANSSIGMKKKKLIREFQTDIKNFIEKKKKVIGMESVGNETVTINNNELQEIIKKHKNEVQNLTKEIQEQEQEYYKNKSQKNIVINQPSEFYANDVQEMLLNSLKTMNIENVENLNINEELNINSTRNSMRNSERDNNNDEGEYVIEIGEGENTNNQFRNIRLQNNKLRFVNTNEPTFATKRNITKIK
jgi:hypothetical protein